MTATSPAPLVSIITPTFDHERFIGRCLESVLAQTEPRWEQIVVDDGSTDGTAGIVQAIGDPRIRFVQRPHRGIAGLGEAYNVALGMARGAYVAVLEGDDFWPADKLERQLPAFEDPEIVLSWGLAVETDPDERALRLHPDLDELRRHQHQTAARTVQLLLARNPIAACTVVCRTSALLAIGGFHQPDGLPNVDYPTWLQLCRVGRFAPVDRVVGFYRRHERQVTTTMTAAMTRNLEVGPAFVAHLTEQERRSLGVSVEAASQMARRGAAAITLGAGRAALRAGQPGLARAHFRRALRDGGAGIRIRAVAGLASASLGIDMDGIARASRRLRARREAAAVAAAERAGSTDRPDTSR